MDENVGDASPPKRQYVESDYTTCIICQDASNNKLITPNPQAESLKKLLRFISNSREFTQRQEYDYDYVNGRIKLQTRHYFKGIPFKSYRNPFYITVKQQITVIAI